jgi:hypothetical protein
MPSTLGIQVQEERGPDKSIARLPTARTAFVGRTLRGPVNRPVLVKNFAEFQHVFGGLWQPSLLGYSIEQFFDNGGREALVVRVVNGACAASVVLPAGAGSLQLRALRPGTREFLRASVDYDNIPADNSDEFNLAVQRVRIQGSERVEDQEIFPRLSIRPAAERHLAKALAESELVQLAGPVPPKRPERTLDPASGQATAYVNSNSDGDDGAPLTDYDLIGSALEQTGLFALSKAESFNLLCLPPLSRERDVGPGALLVAARYCKERRALLIVDPPSQWQTVNDALAGMRSWNLASEDAMMYFPQVLAHDKLRGRFESFAPCGAVAGMIARFDEESPLWESAEFDAPVLRPGYRPSCLVAEDCRAKLAAQGVNTIQSLRPATPPSLRQRTLAGGTAAAPDWRFLAARRLSLFIVNCVERGTRWVALAQPHVAVAGLVEAQVRAFFEQLRAAGAFPGRSSEDAFFVVCDGRVNTESAGAPRKFQLLIGFAGARVGEFHTYRITHSASGSEVQPATLNRLNLAQYSPDELRWVDRLASQLQA